MEIDGNDSLSIEYKETIKVIFLKSMDLLINSILNNNINNNNNNNNNSDHLKLIFARK